MNVRAPHRVLRPHRDWVVLDFVLAVVALAFLGLALSGAWTVVNAVASASTLGNECANARCNHLGLLTEKQRVRFANGGYRGLYDIGSSPDYCVLTLSLDSGTSLAAVAGPYCDALTTPSSVQAEVWRGHVVTLTVDGRSLTTFFDPSFGVLSGLLRLIAFVPCALCVALIETDIANHRHVYRVRRRLFGPPGRTAGP